MLVVYGRFWQVASQLREIDSVLTDRGLRLPPYLSQPPALRLTAPQQIFCFSPKLFSALAVLTGTGEFGSVLF